MQDYQELHMDDIEEMRKRIKTMLERKATLMSEVRFLRRRYRHLKQDQPVLQPPGVEKVRGRSNGGGKKSKTQIVRTEVSGNYKRSEAETKHVSLPDLNHSGNETKTSLEKRVLLFDLNQISGEEEEETEAANNGEERIRVEETSSCKRTSIIEMQQQKKEMKISSCRNGGSGSNKRKISWQDPVGALRV